MIPESDRITSQQFGQEMMLLASHSGNFSRLPEPGLGEIESSIRENLYSEFYEAVATNLTSEQFSCACRNWRAMNSVLPTAKQLIDLALGTVEQRAATAWHDLERMAASGRYDYSRLSKEAYAAFRAIGGSTALELMDTSKRSFLEREFVQKFQVYSSPFARSQPIFADTCETLESLQKVKAIAPGLRVPIPEMESTPPTPESRRMVEEVEKGLRSQKGGRVVLASTPKIDTPQEYFANLREKLAAFREAKMWPDAIELLKTAQDYSRTCEDPAISKQIYEWANRYLTQASR